jgi:uncharacterized protein with PIN domain
MPTLTPKRGAIPTPRNVLAAATPHRALVAAPPNFVRIPKKIAMWGNDIHGDCVTAEEAFAKACNNPEVFIPDNDAVAWAKNHGVLEGAGLVQVMQFMQNDGFAEGPTIYDDGPFFSVNWNDASVLRSAILAGPVKLGVAADQILAAWSAGEGKTGWFGVDWKPDNNEDHCVALCGYGTLGWLAQQLQVSVPKGVDASRAGFALFTWNSIGIVDAGSMLAVTHEAWLRQPTTVPKSLNVWLDFDLNAVTGAPPMAGNPSGYVVEAEKRQHVVYRGFGGEIRELATWTGDKSWGQFDLTAATGAPPAASDPFGYAFELEKRQHIVYRGVDNHIHELAISIGGSSWGHFDLTAVTGAPPALGDLIGYAFEAEKRQHIVYRGVDNHIHELAISMGGNAWSHFDLTAGTGATLAAGDPFGYVFKAEKRQHIVYRGVDNHIHELAISMGGNAWGNFDLTGGTGATPAAGDPVGYAFETENRQHVVYRGVDSHIHELAISIGGNAWGHFDLTAGTGATLAAGDPFGYAFEAENRQHVVYRGVDGHIHELAISIGGNAWGHFDLTAGTGGPPAAGDPVGYAFEVERRQHVVYRGADNHVHELAISM